MSVLLEGILFLGRETLRIVLPSACAVCREELPWRARAGSCCEACWGSLPRLDGVRCRRCAAPWPGAPEGADFLCLHCAAIPNDPLDRIDAWGAYEGGLERLLVAFKFERHDFLDEPLARLLLDAWISRG
ncbi:MAG TPA: double zinc ribbon domain-containing protein, partial [Thermoanaerobaculia bacterium]|nr:double zinc ribbon domain-containing protein [Thermoanaerobaculia bacterium]